MIEQKHQGKSLQTRAIRVLVVLSVITFLITLIAGIMTDSMALLLSAAVEGVIVFMSFFVHSTFKKMERPPDRLFHFGYDKFEPLTVVLQGSLIMFSCIVASYYAIQELVHSEDIAGYDIAVYASVVTGLIALFTAFYIKGVSARTRSHMLRTSALHCFVDSVLSFGMAFGFSLGFYMRNMGYYHITPYIDPVMTLTLSVMLVFTPVKLVRNSLHQLLDGAPSEDVCEVIEDVIERHKAKAFGIRSVQIRKAGERVFLYVCFEIHGHTTMNQAQEFVKAFEDDISRNFPKYDCIVYFYPAIGR